MTRYKCTGHRRWGTRFDPSTLLKLLLWQKHVAFLHVCKSHPQELLVFCYSVTLLWSVLFITTDFATEAQIWAQGKYGRFIKEVAKNCQRERTAEAPQNNTPTVRQGMAGDRALSQGLPCYRGAAAQQIWQGKSVTPPQVGGRIKWELRY